MSLSKINNGLLILILVINGYIILAPLLPEILFHLQVSQGRQQTLERSIEPKTKPTASIPAVNEVIVPSMLLDQPILEGAVTNQYKTLDRGIWRWPSSSTPDKGSNTVLIGHRFTYTNPRGVFYFLNKIKLGDSIGVYWNRKAYNYKVITISQVAPNDTMIEQASADPKLTLFTCTPLWLPKNRLVVVANLEGPPRE